MTIKAFVWRAFLFAISFISVTALALGILNRNSSEQPNQEIVKNDPTNGQLFADSDLTVEGKLIVQGEADFKGGVILSDKKGVNGKVLTLDEGGNLKLVNDDTGTSEIIYQTKSDLPTHKIGGMVFSDGTKWNISSVFYHDVTTNAPLIGIATTEPEAKLHINTGNIDSKGLIVRGEFNQAGNLTEWQNSAENVLVKITPTGKMIFDNSADHMLELRPSGNTGYLSSSGGAIFIENTYNLGTGLGIYSNVGSDALGNMINVKVDNPLYPQAAFYMNYDGSSNAVEIVSNSTDTSSNALSVTGNNPNDSTVGFIGYETGRGTLKISHYGDGSDDNASGLSIDLKGTGTDAQGIYIDSTATGGTDGNLLRLRNQSVDRFVVNSLGSLSVGGNGTNTSITKYGNTAGDEFFVGTNGAFRIQRSATNSEAFRTQISGDTQGRWLGTSDGKLKFGDGSNTQDVVLSRTSAGLMLLESDLTISSRAVNNDVLTLSAFDGSNLAKFSETTGGQGVLEIDDATGAIAVTFRADGGNSYISSGNFGLGSTTFGTSAANVFAIGNGTAPSTSITNGVQLWAEDVLASSELRVRDEAGNLTTLSPHNFSLITEGASEDMAWSFYSEKGDIAVNADITRALRIVEELSGERIIYMKNLATGNYIDNFSKNNKENDLTINLDDYVKKDELSTHLSLKEKSIEFLSNVLYKAKAIFTNSVEFLASVKFNGAITVNADTGGVIKVPANTKNYKVSFTRAFSQKPLVYVTTDDTTIDFKVKDITQMSFNVEIINPQNRELSFQWLALLSENTNLLNLEIVESSKTNSDPIRVEIKNLINENEVISSDSAQASESALVPLNSN